MFTGLIEATGYVSDLDDGTLSIAYSSAEGLELGESISVSGICLTVTRLVPGGFQVDVSPTTAKLTTARLWRVGTTVNLERAMSLGDRLGGHIVTGHVDGIGVLAKRTPAGNSNRLFFQAEPEVAHQLVPRGSIAVDGISLTLNEVSDSGFAVTIIPETERKTTIGALQVGQEVNLETDILGKYVLRLLEPYVTCRGEAS